MLCMIQSVHGKMYRNRFDQTYCCTVYSVCLAVQSFYPAGNDRTVGSLVDSHCFLSLVQRPVCWDVYGNL